MGGRNEVSYSLPLWTHRSIVIIFDPRWHECSNTLQKLGPTSMPSLFLVFVHRVPSAGLYSGLITVV